MSLIKNVSIGSKMKIGFFSLTAMTLALGILFVFLVEKLSDNARVIADVNLVSVRATSDINTNTSDFRVAEIQHILSEDQLEMNKYDKDMEKQLDNIKKNEEAYEAVITESDKPVYEKFKELWGFYLREHAKLDPLSRANKNVEATKIARGDSQTYFDDAFNKLLDLMKMNSDAARKARDQSVNLHNLALYSTVGFVLLAIVFGLWLANSITGMIAAPVENLTAALSKIADGDLRQSALPVAASDEVGQATKAFNSMLASIKDMTGQTRSATQNITSATAEILASTQEQAASTAEQAAAVQQTTATVEEINQSGNQVSERAKQVAASAEAASATSNSGIQAVQSANRTMDAIREQAEAVAENIVTLSEKTQTVGEIVATVNDIAEQSNLLALNAAIEAAAAGEHGRRFSVVAAELKNLADQSKAATVQVRTILGDIQKGINTSVMLTEETVKRVELGKQQSDVAERTIRQMAESTVGSVQAFQQIVAATNQQQIGFEQVTQALKNIRVASQQTAAGTQQMEKAAANLNALGQQLFKSVERYEL